MGQNGSSQEQQGEFTARAEASDSYTLSSNEVLCDASFDFEVDSGGVARDFYYDDHFIFVLNDHALWEATKTIAICSHKPTALMSTLGMTFVMRTWTSIHSRG